MTGDSRNVIDSWHRTAPRVAEARRAVAHGDQVHRNDRIEALEELLIAELYEQAIAERQARDGVGRD